MGAALEKAGLLVPAGIAGDVVDDVGAERNFQLLDDFPLKQADLLAKLVVQEVFERHTQL